MLFAELVLNFQTDAHFLRAGDVLMSGHPAAARHRIDRIGNDPAIGEFVDGGAGNDAVCNALADVFVGLRKHLEPQIEPVPDEFADGGPGLHLFG